MGRSETGRWLLDSSEVTRMGRDESLIVLPCQVSAPVKAKWLDQGALRIRISSCGARVEPHEHVTQTLAGLMRPGGVAGDDVEFGPIALRGLRWRGHASAGAQRRARDVGLGQAVEPKRAALARKPRTSAMRLTSLRSWGSDSRNSRASRASRRFSVCSTVFQSRARSWKASGIWAGTMISVTTTRPALAV